MGTNAALLLVHCDGEGVERFLAGFIRYGQDHVGGLRVRFRHVPDDGVADDFHAVGATLRSEVYAARLPIQSTYVYFIDIQNAADNNLGKDVETEYQ